MSETAKLLIDCKCELSEGPFWHQARQELFWFDIKAGDLYRAKADGTIVGQFNFGEPVSAAALVDADTILVASASAIVSFSLDSGERAAILALEADNPVTRANDSRVSPQGAWWIGTMGKKGERGAGSVYHFRGGALTRMLDNVSIPNSICFSPDGEIGYFSDTVTGQINRVALDRETGAPAGEWETFVEPNAALGSPDGSVVDSQGYLWNARYGGGRVVRFAPDGSVDREVIVPAPNVTCPALGGPQLKTLFITTARQDMTAGALADAPDAGGIFAIEVDVAGLAENPILL